jgi:hypothetical protein
MAVPRSRCLSTKVTEEEYATFERLAGDQSLSEWARDVLLSVTKGSGIEQILLAEFLALRMILVNLYFAVTTGDPPTVDAMHALIDRADREKVQKAIDRLAPPRRGR